MKAWSWIVFVLTALLTLLIVWKASAYWLPQSFGGEENLVNLAGPLPLAVHAASGSAALLFGVLQFITPIRNRLPALHRWIGRFYVLACYLGAVTGILLAFGSTGGWVASTGFLLLGLSWAGATYLALASIRQRSFEMHRRWMIRSFALTFAAVTLRVQIPIFLISGLPYELAYSLVAWTCWVPNLLVAQIWIMGFRPPWPGSARRLA